MCRLLFILFLILSPNLRAGFYLQHSFGHNTTTNSDSGENVENSNMRNSFILGAMFGKSGQWVIGQGITHSSSSTEATSLAGAEDNSFLELGPRVIFFFNQAKNFYISATYNFYAKGSRTKQGATEDIDGSSLMGAIGVQMKATKMIYFGISMNYHSISISESTVGNTKSEVSHSYSSLYPAIELSIRFK